MKPREVRSFDLNIINIMTYLYEKDAVDDGIMEVLRTLNFEYHTELDKNSLLLEQINTDHKTKLLKYRDDYLTIVVKSASRVISKMNSKCYDISYIRFDIDDFSTLNNKFGHDRGDIVLCDIAKLLQENSRPTDYLIRFGGEEFDVLLPATDKKGAVKYLNNIYDKMKKLHYNFDNIDVRIFVSAGYSIFSIPFERLKHIDNEEMKSKYLSLQRFADDALYDAKLSGKNQYKEYDANLNYRDIRNRYCGGEVNGLTVKR